MKTTRTLGALSSIAIGVLSSTFSLSVNAQQNQQWGQAPSTNRIIVHYRETASAQPAGVMAGIVTLVMQAMR